MALEKHLQSQIWMLSDLTVKRPYLCDVTIQHGANERN